MDISLFLYKKEYLASHTVGLYFDRKNYQYDFFPGQYVSITLPFVPNDGNGATRDFTITSSPTEKNMLLIMTKEGITDAKKALTNLSPGQNVTCTKPQGGFYLREEDISPRIFLSGGVGIAPFYSMITYNIDKNLHIPMTLIASFSSSADAVLFDDLSALARTHAEIKVIYSISHIDPSEVLIHQESGRISEEMIKKYGGELDASLFMIAGSPEMVDDTQELLVRMGISEKSIQSEQFPGY